MTADLASCPDAPDELSTTRDEEVPSSTMDIFSAGIIASIISSSLSVSMGLVR